MRAVNPLDVMAHCSGSLYVLQQQEYSSDLMDAAQAVEALVEAGWNAAGKLDGMARTFSGANFTDRHGDGPAMQRYADALRAALAPFGVRP